MRKSDFLEFRVLMGNFSNEISSAPGINYFYYYGDPRRSSGAGQISDRCLGIFKGYIPEFTAYLEKLREFLKTMREYAKKRESLEQKIKIKKLKEKNKLKIDQLKKEKELLIEKLKTIEKKKLTISDDTFNYLKGTRLAIKDSKDDMCDLINKVKKFNAEIPMSPTELKRAYIRTSHPINSAVRDPIAEHVDGGISFIRNLSAGIQISSLMKKQIETLGDKTVYRYITLEELLERYLDCGYKSLSKIDGKERESKKFKEFEKENNAKIEFGDSLSEAFYEGKKKFVKFLNDNKSKINFKVDPGFNSTTIKRGGDCTRFGNIELEIKLPKGSKVLDLIEECETQSEILLKKYTKFVFQEATESRFGGVYVTLKVTIA